MRLFVDEPSPHVFVTDAIPGHVGEAAQLPAADESVHVMVHVSLVHCHLPDRHSLKLNRVRSFASFYEVRYDRVHDRFLHPVEVVLMNEKAFANMVGDGDDLPVATVVEEHLKCLGVAIDSVDTIDGRAVVVGSVIEELGEERRFQLLDGRARRLQHDAADIKSYPFVAVDELFGGELDGFGGKFIDG